MEICDCKFACYEEAQENLENCYEDCETTYPAYINWCKHECRVSAETNEENCANECGEYEDAQVIDSWTLQTWMWTGTGVSVNTSNASLDDYAFQLGYGPGSLPHKIVMPLEHNYYGVAMSYCIRYEIVINYEDGSCCYFSGYECFLIG